MVYTPVCGDERLLGAVHHVDEGADADQRRLVAVRAGMRECRPGGAGPRARRRWAAPLPERRSLCFQRLEPPDTVLLSVTQQRLRVLHTRACSCLAN